MEHAAEAPLIGAETVRAAAQALSLIQAERFDLCRGGHPVRLVLRDFPLSRLTFAHRAPINNVWAPDSRDKMRVV